MCRGDNLNGDENTASTTHHRPSHPHQSRWILPRLQPFRRRRIKNPDRPSDHLGRRLSRTGRRGALGDQHGDDHRRPSLFPCHGADGCLACQSGGAWYHSTTRDGRRSIDARVDRPWHDPTDGLVQTVFATRSGGRLSKRDKCVSLGRRPFFGPEAYGR